MAEVLFSTLPNARIPGYALSQLQLDGHILRIADEGLTTQSDTTALTVADGIATVLHRWCPAALLAFLDLDAWFSFTWILTCATGTSDETRLEIGRVRNEVTMGVLVNGGETWREMISYVICKGNDDDAVGRSVWIPNPSESMLDGRELDGAEEVEALGRSFVRDLVIERRWEGGRGMQHQLWVEYAPMDIFGDGIAMNPHWLYRSLDLTVCTTCDVRGRGQGMLRRCGRCGTATYCSAECQRRDWAVHKAICNMSDEERGKALYLTQDHGLINWGRSKHGHSTTVRAGSQDSKMSDNPHFVAPQARRPTSPT